MAPQPKPEIRSIRAAVAREFQTVAVEHGKTLAPLADELGLFESGLDPLGLAIVVTSLEQRLGVDPFASGEFIESPITLSDFVRMYERVLPRFA